MRYSIDKEVIVSEFITAWRPLLEVSYFIASILLVGGIGLSFFQLRAINRDSRLRIKRTAAENGIRVVERFFSDFVPASNDFYALRMEKEIPTYKGTLGNFSRKSIPADQLANAISRFNLISWGEATNQLEALAAVLISGVGDENIAYRVIGKSFCTSVEQYYDLIAYCRNDENINNYYYRNTVELYRIWRPRLAKEVMNMEKDRIEKEIGGLPDKKLEPLEDR